MESEISKLLHQSDKSDERSLWIDKGKSFDILMEDNKTGQKNGQKFMEHPVIFNSVQVKHKKSSIDALIEDSKRNLMRDYHEAMDRIDSQSYQIES